MQLNGKKKDNVQQVISADPAVGNVELKDRYDTIATNSWLQSAEETAVESRLDEVKLMSGAKPPGAYSRCSSPSLQLVH